MCRKLIIVAIIFGLFGYADSSFARKKGYRFKTSSAAKANNKGEASSVIYESLPDSAILKRHFQGRMLSGKLLENVVLTGFDKKRNNSKESFFIINNTGSALNGVGVDITYLTPDGRMLTHRYAVISITIPAGETRKVDIPAWDTQHSFYYLKSDPDPSRGNPFNVVMIPFAVSQDCMESDNAE